MPIEPKKPDDISQEDWEGVDSPELTPEQLSRMRPLRESRPEFYAKVVADQKRRRGERGPQKAPTKVSTTLRLSQPVIDHFKAGGPGWQTRIDRALLDLVEADSKG